MCHVLIQGEEGIRPYLLGETGTFLKSVPVKWWKPAQPSALLYNLNSVTRDWPKLRNMNGNYELYAVLNSIYVAYRSLILPSMKASITNAEEAAKPTFQTDIVARVFNNIPGSMQPTYQSLVHVSAQTPYMSIIDTMVTFHSMNKVLKGTTLHLETTFNAGIKRILND